MYITKNCPSSVRARIAIERRIVRKVVTDLLKAGYALSVFDGEEEHKRTTLASDIYRDIRNTDEDYLFVWDALIGPARYGWVRFVYGNDGWDVICDYTTNLETVLAGANALADSLA